MKNYLEISLAKRFLAVLNARLLAERRRYDMDANSVSNFNAFFRNEREKVRSEFSHGISNGPNGRKTSNNHQNKIAIGQCGYNKLKTLQSIWLLVLRSNEHRFGLKFH